MYAENPSYGQYPPIITLSENLRSSPSSVSWSLSRIISYLLLVDSSTWNFHATNFVALNSGNQKSIVSFFELVNFPAWVSHVVFSVYFYLSFDVSLPITIVELIPLSNIIPKNCTCLRILHFVCASYIFYHRSLRLRMFFFPSSHSNSTFLLLYPLFLLLWI